MPFGTPMKWSEPINHETDCYFCLTNIGNARPKTKHLIVYPNITSITKPRPHNENCPVPIPPPYTSENEKMSTDTSSGRAETSASTGETFDTPHMILLSELNDLARDLNLTIEKSEILASRLKQWNLLASNTTVTHFRQRGINFSKYYKETNELSACSDVNGLFAEMKQPYNPHEWRLFIDASSRSLKSALVHNGNKKPIVPLAYAIGLKETYESMSRILKEINYAENQWKICVDFKVVALLMGIQLGNTKYPCFLCHFDSQARDQHYIRKQWPERKEFLLTQHNVKHEPLVDQKNILLPPLNN